LGKQGTAFCRRIEEEVDSLVREGTQVGQLREREKKGALSPEKCKEKKGAEFAVVLKGGNASNHQFPLPEKRGGAGSAGLVQGETKAVHVTHKKEGQRI